MISEEWLELTQVLVLILGRENTIFVGQLFRLRNVTQSSL